MNVQIKSKKDIDKLSLYFLSFAVIAGYFSVL